MGRSYGRVACAIWDTDDDFMELSMGAQRTYLMLASQSDISACGMLPLTLRRWQQRMRDDARPMLQGWLDELTAARFLIVDDDTQELLVRTFVKHDGGAHHSKRVLAIHGASKNVRSPLLRAAMAEEFGKLGLIPQFAVPSAPILEPDRIIAGHEPTDRLSVATEVPIDTPQVKPFILHPSSFILHPSSSTPPNTAPPSPPPAAVHDEPLLILDVEPAAPERDRFDEFWKAYPKKADKADAVTAYAKARRKVSQQVLIDGAERYRDDPNRTAGYTKNPATWLNKGSWGNEPEPSRIDNRGKPSLGDTVRRNIDVAQQMQDRADAARQQTITSYRTAIA